jgi:hypothetical protein
MSYARRLAAERRLVRSKNKSPPVRVVPILSTNRKTVVSINLPVRNCRPTRRCAAACYACEGPIAWKNSIRKALAVDAALRRGEIEGLIWECRMLQGVRLCGSGDMTTEHTPAILKLAEACPDTTFWGFTRRREVAEAINGRCSNLSLILTFDITSPKGRLRGYDGPLAFGPRGPSDGVPDDPRIVVIFPEHHAGRTIADIPEHPKDCPATRGMDRHHVCQRCGRCWKPFEAMRVASERK